MKIGSPKESKEQEFRVGLTPESVVQLVQAGHEVWIERGAGVGIGADDEEYIKAGAKIAEDMPGLMARVELVVKVKEPTAEERRCLTPEHTLFAYLHLASDPAQASELMASRAICIAYETVTDDEGRLPLLAPMSEIAGRLAVQAAADHLVKHRGGRGVLLGGATGVPAAKVVIIGGGVVGSNAALIAQGLGARVTVLDKSSERLGEIGEEFSNRAGNPLELVLSTEGVLAEQVREADLVVGAVLVPGGKAAKLITAGMVKSMRPGTVIADVAIDQGGCCENSRPTTHAEPTYLVDGVIHYCVANIPGAVPLTSSLALNRVTLPQVMKLADEGVVSALKGAPHLLDGLNVCGGKITREEVARDLGLEFTEPLVALNSITGN
ncbi:MAG: alanine dehydrogenase [Pseudohongiellaceae bacterium]